MEAAIEEELKHWSLLAAETKVNQRKRDFNSCETIPLVAIAVSIPLSSRATRGTLVLANAAYVLAQAMLPENLSDCAVELRFNLEHNSPIGGCRTIQVAPAAEGQRFGRIRAIASIKVVQ